MYGLVPRTYCGIGVAGLSPSADRADGDPLDICVLSERPIDKADIVLVARVVGGLRMLDRGEADDKIIAVLSNDPFWATVQDISEVPENVVARLDHYFRTYKLTDPTLPAVEIEEIYGRKTAEDVVIASMDDYRNRFPESAVS